MTVENRDVFVEATWTYSRRVTGSPVREHTAGDWPRFNNVICAKGYRRHRGGIVTILLALSSLKHLKCLQTYSSFSGSGSSSGGTVGL